MEKLVELFVLGGGVEPTEGGSPSQAAEGDWGQSEVMLRRRRRRRSMVQGGC